MVCCEPLLNFQVEAHARCMACGKEGHLCCMVSSISSCYHAYKPAEAVLHRSIPPTLPGLFLQAYRANAKTEVSAAVSSLTDC